MKKLIFTSLFLVAVLELFAQTDTVFWFAPTFVSNNGNQPVVLRMANATNLPTQVRIYTPAALSTLNVTITIPANGSESYDLTSRIGLLTNVKPHEIKNTGIKIESQQAITAYHEVVGKKTDGTIGNPEIFVLKGRKALGNSFFIPSQNFWFTDNNPDSDGIDGKTKPGWYNGEARATIDIVAVEDNTEVKITPTNPYQPV